MPRLNLEAFAKLCPQDLDLIDRIAGQNARETAARRDLIREGEKPRGVILILEGWACCYKQLRDGGRQITSFLLPGDLGDANVFLLAEMDHSIGAITPVRYAEILPGDFDRLLNGSAAAAKALWRHQLVTAAINREWVVNVGQRSAYERIAHLICELFVRLRVARLTNGDSIEWPLTQSDIAEATGLTAVHVNRNIQQLRRAGLIELRGRKLTVPDLARLESVGAFNPNYLHLDAEDGPRHSLEREDA